jgi:CAP-Gly domain-containing linker protein 1
MQSESEIIVESWRNRLDQEKSSLVKKIEDLETAVNGNRALSGVSSIQTKTSTSVAVSSGLTSTSLTSSTTTSSATSSPEDKEQYESQIEFLNSVIVDMQKKNDELKSKIQVLEEFGDISTDFNGTADSMLKGVNGRRAPRLFCDICDLFDLHDTDECPQQAGQMEDTNAHSKHNGSRAQERAYCASCEVFGHWTKNCTNDDNESF